MTKVPLKYLPKRLSPKDKKAYSVELRKSRRSYKKGKYITRKRVKSFNARPSKYVVAAKKLYDVETISANPHLAQKTGCSVDALGKIVKKGQGAYYSSGSRPNQTGHSWGRARLASAITGGKAAAIDFLILKEGCKPNSKALTLAKKARRKHGKGTRKVPKTKMRGGTQDSLQCIGARDGVSGCRSCCDLDQACIDECMKF